MLSQEVVVLGAETAQVFEVLTVHHGVYIGGFQNFAILRELIWMGFAEVVSTDAQSNISFFERPEIYGVEGSQLFCNMLDVFYVKLPKSFS